MGKKETEMPLDELERQVGVVMEEIKKQPAMKRHILSNFVLNIFAAVKETLRKQGRVAPLYLILAETVDFGIPPVTDDVLSKAKELKAEAIITIEGFHSVKDISDVLYHISMSAPSLGVMGWVLKVRIGDRRLEFVRELPYLFDSKEKVRSLGQLVEEMEGT